jgi:hypothetical protein
VFSKADSQSDLSVGQSYQAASNVAYTFFGSTESVTVYR